MRMLQLGRDPDLAQEPFGAEHRGESGCSTFTATWRSCLTSCARKTVAIPPRPISRSIVYVPVRLVSWRSEVRSGRKPQGVGVEQRSAEREKGEQRTGEQPYRLALRYCAVPSLRGGCVASNEATPPHSTADCFDRSPSLRSGKLGLAMTEGLTSRPVSPRQFGTLALFALGTFGTPTLRYFSPARVPRRACADPTRLTLRCLPPEARPTTAPRNGFVYAPARGSGSEIHHPEGERRRKRPTLSTGLRVTRPWLPISIVTLAASLIAEQPSALLGGLAVLGVVTTLLWTQAPHATLLTWAGLLVVITSVRALLWLRGRTASAPEDLLPMLRVTTSAMGLAWGAGFGVL